MFTFLVVFPVRADETSDKIDELRAKIEELTKQAETYRGNVLEKQKEADTLKRQIDILNNQIWRLEADIGITENKIEASHLEILDLEEKIFDTKREIQSKKSSIGGMITDLDRRDHVDIVATLIRSKSLSDFANESQQSAILTGHLNELLNQFKEEKTKLENQKDKVARKKSELEVLNDQQVNQRSSLAVTKSSQNKLLADTKGQESQYQKLLNEAETQKAVFFAELQSLEQNAVASGNVIVHVTATAVPARGTKIFQAPHHDKYYITQNYGMTAYAKRGAYGGAIHNGVDVASGCGSPIYAIGSGKVFASGSNAGFGNWIAVQHDAGGGMVSIYGHMVRGTILANGTSVTINAILGYEGTTGTSTGCHVHLSVYRDFFTYINPKNEQLYFNYADGSLNPRDYVTL